MEHQESDFFEKFTTKLTFTQNILNAGLDQLKYSVFTDLEISESCNLLLKEFFKNLVSSLNNLEIKTDYLDFLKQFDLVTCTDYSYKINFTDNEINIVQGALVNKSIQVIDPKDENNPTEDHKTKSKNHPQVYHHMNYGHPIDRTDCRILDIKNLTKGLNFNKYLNPEQPLLENIAIHPISIIYSAMSVDKTLT